MEEAVGAVVAVGDAAVSRDDGDAGLGGVEGGVELEEEDRCRVLAGEVVVMTG